MTFGVLLLIFLRSLLGYFIGGEAFKRRLIVLGAGPRAERIRKLGGRRGRGFSIVGYIAMNDGAKVIPAAIDRSAIYNLSDFVVRLGASEVVLALEERRNALPLSDQIGRAHV